MKNDIHGLLFSLQKEFFGISVENVLRVINLENLIRIPKAPEFISGAINLEGNVVPVVDLAKKIDLGKTPIHDKSKVIILEINNDEGDIQVGVIIDDVLDVVHISSSEIQAPPLENMGFDTNTLDGMYKSNEHFYMILSAKKIFKRELAELVQ
ncbi:chemotaxis protein CheW [Flexithrix dorotheae]|uniref:chemotaxis protein CheW n=1 Tax=Flexithrix dorotheae TaxID=70993 RepID=UPI00035E70EA|nr:chemotaxis protein CheW [Flexithrix dorotheae]